MVVVLVHTKLELKYQFYPKLELKYQFDPFSGALSCACTFNVRTDYIMDL